ncbi:MAG: GNAT family protein [Candidatus Sulfotelmatobacter sp.]
MSLTASPLNIVTPFTLDGSIVRLEPIRREHAGIFWEIAKNDLDNIFQWIPYRMKAREDFEHLIEKALGEQERGESVVFATVERKSGQVIGSTRFMNIDRVNRRVEIGSTWIAPAWHRTAINTEAKYLMLRHAFEVWQCMRVELKTDALNQRSRNAILRLGAKEEGTLRKHLITWTGRVRDSVYFSILDTEWPEVKIRLEEKLAKHPSKPNKMQVAVGLNLTFDMGNPKLPWLIALTRDSLNQLEQEYLRVGSENCGHLRQKTQLSAFLLCGIRSLSLLRGMLRLLEPQWLDSHAALHRAFLESWYLQFDFRAKKRTAAHVGVETWFRKQSKLWEKKHTRQLVKDTLNGLGGKAPEFDLEYEALSNATHPTNEAAYSSQLVVVATGGISPNGEKRR